MNQNNIITSYGIARDKKNKVNNNYELLFIKKRVTYAYITFIKGIYNKNNNNDIMKLLNNMTTDEKICIMSLNFNIMWYKSYVSLPYNRTISRDISKYEKSKNRFEKSFLYDDGKRLLSLIKKATSVTKLWEIPKGMINKNESDINAAIREFGEETNIKKNKYKILYNINPEIYIFSDENITYKYVYYIAILLDNKYTPNVELKINSTSMMETIEIKFLNINQIMIINDNKIFVKFIKKIFKLVKPYIY